MPDLQNTPSKIQGRTLPELLIILAMIAPLIFVCLSLYKKWLAKTHLHQAQNALLANSQVLAKHYQQHLRYQTHTRQWPKLPVSQTRHFCIRPQGNPHYAEAARYTLKAVALNPEQEPHILKINQDGTLIICESSKSRCDDWGSFFQGGGGIDQNCRLFHR